MHKKSSLIATGLVVAIAAVSLAFNLEIIVIVPLLPLALVALIFDTLFLIGLRKKRGNMVLPILLIALALAAPLSQLIVFNGLRIGP